jgi:hypothetical protein
MTGVSGWLKRTKSPAGHNGGHPPVHRLRKGESSGRFLPRIRSYFSFSIDGNTARVGQVPYRVPVVRESLREIRNLFRRISLLISRRELRSAIFPQVQCQGCLERGATQCLEQLDNYMRHIESLRNEYPWLSRFEHELIYRAWKSASTNSYCNLSISSGQQKYKSLSGSNSMPPQATQQESKHGE